MERCGRSIVLTMELAGYCDVMKFETEVDVGRVVTLSCSMRTSHSHNGFARSHANSPISIRC